MQIEIWYDEDKRCWTAKGEGAAFFVIEAAHYRSLLIKLASTLDELAEDDVRRGGNL